MTGSDVRLTPLDIRRLCLHQLLSRGFPEALLTFLDACEPAFQGPLLHSAFRTACGLLCVRSGVAAGQRPRAIVQEGVELALCLEARLQRCGEPVEPGEQAALRAMRLLLRLREEDCWLDEVRAVSVSQQFARASNFTSSVDYSLIMLLPKKINSDKNISNMIAV